MYNRALPTDEILAFLYSKNQSLVLAERLNIRIILIAEYHSFPVSIQSSVYSPHGHVASYFVAIKYRDHPPFVRRLLSRRCAHRWTFMCGKLTLTS